MYLALTRKHNDVKGKIFNTIKEAKEYLEECIYNHEEDYETFEVFEDYGYDWVLILEYCYHRYTDTYYEHYLFNEPANFKEV